MKKIILGIVAAALVASVGIGGALSSKSQTSNPTYESVSLTLNNTNVPQNGGGGVSVFVFEKYSSPTQAIKDKVLIDPQSSKTLNIAVFASSSRSIIDSFNDGSIYVKNNYKNQDIALTNSKSGVGKVTADALHVDHFNLTVGKKGTSINLDLQYKNKDVGFASVLNVGS